MMMRTGVALTLTLAVSTTGMPSALAQADYPNKPIRVLVGFAPGGGTDIVARIVAPKVGELLGGQRVVIDNRPGAAQAIASELTAKASPDGYTLFMASAAFTINPSLRKTLPFDSVRDFAPIALAAGTPNVLVIHPSVRARSIKDLIAEARKGKLLYGSAGVGAPSHLSGVLFGLLAHVDVTHVPYKGSGQVMSDLLGGQLQMSFPALSGVLAHIKSGKLIPLGVTSRKRSSALPNVPTIEESGLADYEASSWFGFMAPAGLHKALLTKINTATNDALKSADVREQLQRQAADPIGGTPQEFSALIAKDIERWRKVIAAAGLKPE